MKRNPISVRLEADELAFVTTYARNHQCSQSQAVRALLQIGHKYMGTSGVNFIDAVHGLDTTVAGVADDVVEIRGELACTREHFERVWVELLMGMRLLLDVQHRGFVERAKEMTSVYIERNFER